MTEPLTGTLAPHLPVLVRMVDQHGHEYPARIESVDATTITITAPTGGSAALLASGRREVEISWLSPRGRYEQRCDLVDTGGGASGGAVGTRRTGQWLLRPSRRPVLIQRRRYVRVAAEVDVQVVVDDAETPATTVDISEGGFRVRLPRRTIEPLARATVRATMGGANIAILGYVLRSIDVLANQTEAVIAFEADGTGTDAIRRFVLNTQLRARAERTSVTNAAADRSADTDTRST
jgi:hypothetical protein